MTSVWTNGCFDLLHAGHVTFLESAAKWGSLTVFLNSDASIARLKGPSRPIIPLAHRRKMLSALKCVSYIHVFDNDTPVPYWTTLNITPTFYVKDSETDVTHSEEGRWMLERNVAVAVLPRVPDISTTHIIRKIREESGLSR